MRPARTITTWRELLSRLAAAARRLSRAIEPHPAEPADSPALAVACQRLAARLCGARGAGLLSMLPSEARTDGILPTDEIDGVLRAADLRTVRGDFRAQHPGEDLLLSFYEPLLAAYDGRKRRRLGVFYTPQPLVSFIVRSVDAILRREFGLADGLAHAGTWGQAQARRGFVIPAGVDPSTPLVQIFDPAMGSGAFLVEIIDCIHRTLVARWRAAGHGPAAMARQWAAYVPRHLLPRLFGCELMRAPYAIAHLAVAARLAATGYRLRGGDRLHLALANALQEPRAEPAAPSVIVGNPPYAGVSANTGPWITRLIDDYRRVQGEPLREKNPSWLLDDYVKFLRLGQHLLDRTGCGVLGLVSSSGFVANPTFRGLRAGLAASFPRIAILDLHGDAKKRTLAPAGLRDENLFDITQGVCIALLRKGPGPAAREHPAVEQADLWGSRAEKRRFLARHDVHSCSWQAAACHAPHYLFHPLDAGLQAEYSRFRSIHELFRLKGWGFKTRKDYLLVDFERQALVERFDAMAALPAEEATARFGVRPSPYWDFAAAHAQMPADSAALVRPVLFRPFDVRHVYYAKFMIERGDHKYALMQQMFRSNVALMSVRRSESNRPFDHVFCTRQMAVLHAVSAKEANFFYPALAYGAAGHAGNNLPLPLGAGERTGRIAPGQFHYLYAVLHSPAYRARYAGPLRVDFPRVPWLTAGPLFRQLAALGADLVALHLLEADYPAASWNASRRQRAAAGPGNPWADASPRVVGDAARPIAPGYPRYDPAGGGRVLLNRGTWFLDVSPAAWEFRVGGYRVLCNWLRDRRGRTLSEADLQHYRAMVIALSQTLRLMARIDEVIAAHGGWPEAFLTSWSHEA